VTLLGIPLVAWTVPGLILVLFAGLALALVAGWWS
jgi:hypothetical protein